MFLMMLRWKKYYYWNIWFEESFWLMKDLLLILYVKAICLCHWSLRYMIKPKIKYNCTMLFYFRLLNYAHGSHYSFGTAEKLLQNEIMWLKNVRVGKISEYLYWSINDGICQYPKSPHKIYHWLKSCWGGKI